MSVKERRTKIKLSEERLFLNKTLKEKNNNG